MKRIFLLIFIGSCFMFSNTVQGQAVGIRAGLNFSTFQGPLQEGEAYSRGDGFHFGFNYGYKFTNKFMVRAELLYTQVGTVRDYSGPGFYKIYPTDGSPTIYETGDVQLNLNISNAYINIPVVAAYQISPKIEVAGGVSFNFLVNPVARGTIRFESYENPDGIVFRQSLDYRYYQDNAQQGRFSSANNIAILVNGEREDLPRFAGAYYQYTDVQKVGSAFNWFEAGLVGSVNYFFNKGFFAGLSLNYGLTDITNDDMDVSIKQLQSDNKFILRDDKDTNLSLQVSLGFRF
jgi:hypothetical protein